MSTVLILGAGATRAASSISSLSKSPPLDADFFEIAKRSRKALYDKIVEVLRRRLGEYSTTMCASLENTVSYLFLKAMETKRSDEFHKTFLNVLDLLTLVIAENTNRISVGPRSVIYRLLLSELKRLSSARELCVITFNYDLLIERALDEITLHNRGVFSFPGCYELEGVNSSRIFSVAQQNGFQSQNFARIGVCVLKLHGSLNWQSTHTSRFPTPSAVTAPNRQLFVLNAKNIPSELTLRKQRKVYLKPIIVPPIGGKRNILHSSILPLWRKAETYLEKAERVVIVGYSCPPFDLEARFLLAESLRQNNKKKLFVIDPSTVTAARFSEIGDADHITIYDSVQCWLRDAEQ